jgi:hypothetical protein
MMSPPGMSRTLRSSIETDGTTKLTLRARMMLISKTLEFVKFTGTVGENCRIEGA